MIPEKLVKENGDLLKEILWSLTKEDIVQKQRSLAAVRRTMLYSKPLVMGGGGGGGGNHVKSKKRREDGDKESGSREEENVKEELVGDAFEMILRALREKARAMKYVSSRHGPGHWL